MAGDVEDSLLSVTVLLSGSVEKSDEDRMVQELRAHDKPLHLFADVDGYVACGDGVDSSRLTNRPRRLRVETVMAAAGAEGEGGSAEGELGG